MQRLSGKVAIVTGAASGIGKAAVELFRSEGATVVGADVSEGADLRVDAGDEEQVRKLVDAAVGEHGRLDIFFANAGVSGGFASISEQTAADWAEILRINLIGPFLAIKHSMPHMIRQKYGAIVCTASVAGLKSGASGHPYAASKAGVISLVQTTAYSLSGTGVRINAVCPGLIETGMTKPIFDNAKQRGTDHKIGQLNPLKRAGQPHELAAMGLFLASDDASYVNGQAIPVDGGLTASMPYAGKPI